MTASRALVTKSIAVVALVPLALGAWLLSRPGGAQASGDPTIREVEYQLKPDHPRVSAGRIRFNVVNKGKRRHALTIETPQGAVSTPILQPGQSASLRVRLKPGRYKFFCPIDHHKRKGMRGTVRVR